MKSTMTWLIIYLLLVAAHGAAAEKDDQGWISLFDGKSLSGWKASENVDSWKVASGAIVCHGPRSHLFYVGQKEPFVNFEFKADVMTTPGSNSGIYFHTRFLKTGWPNVGHESQVNISHRDPQKTGGLYSVIKVLKPPARDNKYWTQHIIVRGKRIVIKIDGNTVVDYTEPDKVQGGRKLSSGTFALQAHDPASKVYFKNIRVKRLP